MRRHIAKFDYKPPVTRQAKRKKRNESQKHLRNKRLRQTYFATAYNKNKSVDAACGSNRTKKRKKYIETTIDDFFPIAEKTDHEMLIQDENEGLVRNLAFELSNTAKNIIKNVLHSKNNREKL